MMEQKEMRENFNSLQNIVRDCCQVDKLLPNKFAKGKKKSTDFITEYKKFLIKGPVKISSKKYVTKRLRKTAQNCIPLNSHGVDKLGSDKQDFKPVEKTLCNLEEINTVNNKHTENDKISVDTDCVKEEKRKLIGNDSVVKELKVELSRLSPHLIRKLTSAGKSISRKDLTEHDYIRRHNIRQSYVLLKRLPSDKVTINQSITSLISNSTTPENNELLDCSNEQNMSENSVNNKTSHSPEVLRSDVNMEKATNEKQLCKNSDVNMEKVSNEKQLCTIKSSRGRKDTNHSEQKDKASSKIRSKSEKLESAEKRRRETTIYGEESDQSSTILQPEKNSSPATRLKKTVGAAKTSSMCKDNTIQKRKYVRKPKFGPDNINMTVNYPKSFPLQEFGQICASPDKRIKTNRNTNLDKLHKNDTPSPVKLPNKDVHCRQRLSALPLPSSSRFIHKPKRKCGESNNLDSPKTFTECHPIYRCTTKCKKPLMHVIPTEDGTFQLYKEDLVTSSQDHTYTMKRDSNGKQAEINDMPSVDVANKDNFSRTGVDNDSYNCLPNSRFIHKPNKNESNNLDFPITFTECHPIYRCTKKCKKPLIQVCPAEDGTFQLCKEDLVTLSEDRTYTLKRESNGDQEEINDVQTVEDMNKDDFLRGGVEDDLYNTYPPSDHEISHRGVSRVNQSYAVIDTSVEEQLNCDIPRRKRKYTRKVPTVIKVFQPRTLATLAVKSFMGL